MTKKILLSLGVIAVITATGAALISCSSSSEDTKVKTAQNIVEDLNKDLTVELNGATKITNDSITTYENLKQYLPKDFTTKIPVEFSVKFKNESLDTKTNGKLGVILTISKDSDSADTNKLIFSGFKIKEVSTELKNATVLFKQKAFDTLKTTLSSTTIDEFIKDATTEQLLTLFSSDPANAIQSVSVAKSITNPRTHLNFTLIAATGFKLDKKTYEIVFSKEAEPTIVKLAISYNANNDAAKTAWTNAKTIAGTEGSDAIKFAAWMQLDTNNTNATLLEIFSVVKEGTSDIVNDAIKIVSAVANTTNDTISITLDVKDSISHEITGTRAFKIKFTDGTLVNDSTKQLITVSWIENKESNFYILKAEFDRDHPKNIDITIDENNLVFINWLNNRAKTNIESILELFSIDGKPATSDKIISINIVNNNKWIDFSFIPNEQFEIVISNSDNSKVLSAKNTDFINPTVIFNKNNFKSLTNEWGNLEQTFLENANLLENQNKLKNLFDNNPAIKNVNAWGLNQSNTIWFELIPNADIVLDKTWLEINFTNGNEETFEPQDIADIIDKKVTKLISGATVSGTISLENATNIDWNNFVSDTAGINLLFKHLPQQLKSIIDFAIGKGMIFNYVNLPSYNSFPDIANGKKVLKLNIKILMNKTNATTGDLYFTGFKEQAKLK